MQVKTIIPHSPFPIPNFPFLSVPEAPVQNLPFLIPNSSFLIP